MVKLYRQLERDQCIELILFNFWFYCWIGFMVIRYYEMMLGKEMIDLYYEYLDNEDFFDKFRIQVQ